MSERGLILAGDVRLGFYDSAGAFLGYAKDPINVTEMTPTPGEGEQRDRVSRMRDTFGQALDSVTLPAPWTLTFTTDSIGRDILRALFLGTDQDIAVASGSVTGEALTAQHDKWVPLEFPQVDNATPPVVTDDTGVTTYTEGTDYLIDLRNGMIQAISTGTITDGESLLVDYSYGARTGFRINGATANELTVAMLLDGRSLRQADSGKVVRWLAKQVTLRPAGGNDIKSNEWVAPQFTGTLITPTGENQPFFYEEYTPGA